MYYIFDDGSGCLFYRGQQDYKSASSSPLILIVRPGLLLLGDSRVILLETSQHCTRKTQLEPQNTPGRLELVGHLIELSTHDPGHQRLCPRQTTR